MSRRAFGEGITVRASSSLNELLRPKGRHDWRGARPQPFPHTIYSLIGCPAPIGASWVLVRRRDDGSCVALATGLAINAAATLNLAQIRHQGATLGADEVHLCGPTEGDAGCLDAAREIAAAQGVPELAPVDGEDL